MNTVGNSDRELSCLRAIRVARAEFFASVLEHAEITRGKDSAGPLTREERAMLRSEHVAHVAEFLFVLKEAQICEASTLRSFLENHNHDMQRLLDECEKGYTRNGLSAARIKRALFSEKQINYLIHECKEGVPRFDQQSLQKIFTQLMSFESCRTVLVLLSESGFLMRHEFNQVLISSKGVLEKMYGEFLSSVVLEIDKSVGA